MTGQRYADFRLYIWKLRTHVSGGDQQILANAPTQRRHRVTEDTGFSSAGGPAKPVPQKDAAIRANEAHRSLAFHLRGSLRPSAALCAARRTGLSSLQRRSPSGIHAAT